MRMVRSHASATSGLWVTMTNVVPISRLIRRIKSTISSDVAVSRSPVGSSPSTSAGLREVAEKIGYSSTTIYLYFKDKGAILREAVLRSFDELNETCSLAAVGPCRCPGRGHEGFRRTRQRLARGGEFTVRPAALAAPGPGLWRLTCDPQRS